MFSEVVISVSLKDSNVKERVRVTYGSRAILRFFRYNFNGLRHQASVAIAVSMLPYIAVSHLYRTVFPELFKFMACKPKGKGKVVPVLN
jgi:hypothetical protein